MSEKDKEVLEAPKKEQQTFGGAFQTGDPQNPDNDQALRHKLGFELPLNKWIAVESLILLIIGSVGAYFAINFNTQVRGKPRDCPVGSDSLFFTVYLSAVVLTSYGILGLLNSGALTRILLAFHLKDEALCLADVFTGICGSVARNFLLVLLFISNIYNIYVLGKYLNRGLQTNMPKKRHTYCRQSVVIYISVANAVVLVIVGYYTFLVLRVIFSTMKDVYRKWRKDKPEEEFKGKYKPAGENIEAELGLLPEQQRGRARQYEKELKMQQKVTEIKERAPKKKKMKNMKNPRKKIRREK